jgi:hypothetical protein
MEYEWFFDPILELGYGIFEAYDYPDGVDLVWTINDVFYTSGTSVIEIFEPIPYPEGGVTVCVGYESEACPEGVFACEWIGEDVEEDCEIEMEVWVQGNMGYAEAGGYPDDAELHWYIEGELFATGVNFIELIDIGFSSETEICVGYFNIEGCGEVFTCDTITTGGGVDCPEEINVIYPKWSFCEWAFEIPGVPPNSSYVHWDFGDGTTEEGSAWAVHNYEEDGVYTITAFVFTADCPNGVEIHVTIEVWECGEEEECINEDVIQEDFACTEEYAPVCGCDDVTYSNECYAYYYHGVTSWVMGECEDAVNDLDSNDSWTV